jgi:hypothetical protein
VGFNARRMDLIFACAVCGMDPGTDSLVVHSLLAAGIATPWYFRTQVLGFVRSLRRRLRADSAPEPAKSCPMPLEDEPPTG